MANAGFNSFYTGLADAKFDWDTATFKAMLVRGYTFNSGHVFVSDVTSAGGSLVSTVSLVNKLVTPDGAWDCDDWTWPSVTAGAAIPAFIVAQTSAVTGGADVAASAQRLVCFFDALSGLPVVPNGQSITHSVDSSQNRLIRI